jgi:glycosyltransferase involved in cell wall biosynthesis
VAAPAIHAQPIPGLLPVDDARSPIRVLIASLARGGAEAIVVDWLREEARRGRAVELGLVHDRRNAWPDPPGIVLRRREGERPADFVRRLARRWRADPAPVSTHLVTDDLLETLWSSGLATVPVVHNDREGWRNDVRRWRPRDVPLAIACADAVRGQMIDSGCEVPVATIRHRPSVGRAAFDPEARRAIREELRIGPGVFLVGVVGAFKPQKDHPRALDVLHRLRRQRDAALVILGGVLDRAGLAELDRTLEAAIALGLTRHLRLPGFVAGVAPWLAACDALLNASRYEGLSIAVQEALAAGLPVVATQVGGQAEIRDDLLQLVDARTDADSLARRLAALPVRTHLAARPAMRIPRLWSVALGARPPEGPALDTLFVTANLNAGGAQRSLANLACVLGTRHRLAVAVCSESTHPEFASTLLGRGVECFRPAADADPLALAESILAHAHRRGARTLCFWNASPRVKLLVAKFAPPALRLVDVSPGEDSFHEMADSGEFAREIAFPVEAWYRRLDSLVVKFGSPTPLPAERVAIIPNGVACAPMRPHAGGSRFLVRGRIAPSKRLERILEAFALLLPACPGAHLDVAGQCEPRYREYGERIAALATGLPVSFLGAVPELGSLAGAHAATIVLGTNQGCPNAILEAMAAGIPVIANASGGTAEIVIDGRTGWLLPEDVGAAQLAKAMAEVIQEPGKAEECAARAHEHVRTRFSLESMAAAYLGVLAPAALPEPESMAPWTSASVPAAALT